MATTVADLIIERLLDWGVDTVFGFPGDGINGIFEAWRENQDKIKYMQVRHEEAAAFAACGYAKFTGGLGVCMATSGPGGIHLLNGLYDAKCDGQPVLAITGHTFHDLIGTHYQQDVDLDKLFMDVAAYNERITGPAHVHNVLDEAITHGAVATHGRALSRFPKTSRIGKAANGRRSKANIPGHSARHLLASVARCRRTRSSRRPRTSSMQEKEWRFSPGGAASSATLEVPQLAEKIGGVDRQAAVGQRGRCPTTLRTRPAGIGLLGTAPSQDAMQWLRHVDHRRQRFPYRSFIRSPARTSACKSTSIPRRSDSLSYRNWPQRRLPAAFYRPYSP